MHNRWLYPLGILALTAVVGAAAAVLGFVQAPNKDALAVSNATGETVLAPSFVIVSSIQTRSGGLVQPRVTERITFKKPDHVTVVTGTSAAGIPPQHITANGAVAQRFLQNVLALTKSGTWTKKGSLYVRHESAASLSTSTQPLSGTITSVAKITNGYLVGLHEIVRVHISGGLATQDRSLQVLKIGDWVVPL